MAASQDLHVWDYDAFAKLMETEGLSFSRVVLKEVVEVAGLKVVSDPTLPVGRLEFRDADGKLLLALDIKS